VIGVSPPGGKPKHLSGPCFRAILEPTATSLAPDRQVYTPLQRPEMLRPGRFALAPSKVGQRAGPQPGRQQETSISHPSARPARAATTARARTPIPATVAVPTWVCPSASFLLDNRADVVCAHETGSGTYSPRPGALGSALA